MHVAVCNFRCQNLKTMAVVEDQELSIYEFWFQANAAKLATCKLIV